MRIVEAFDVFEHCGFRFGLGLEVMPVQELAFQAGKEAFSHRVVEAIADRSHRGPNAKFLRGALPKAIEVY